MNGTQLLTTCVAVALLTASASADYDSDVKSVLRRRCFACHGALKQEANLRLDAVRLMTAGGESGSAVVAGHPDESLLVQRISAEDEADRMPPEGQSLTAAEIAAIRGWIAAGAPAPDNDQPEADPRQHWAYQQPVAAKWSHSAGQWGSNAVDAILREQQLERSLQAVGQAPRGLLLRRVYLDLVGVPPTRRAMQAFVADDRPDAYERVVDRLLCQPQHGERWGRHWMDIWRYTDWYGLGAQLRNSQKHIWHWRDWIVESINTDTGYDEMVRLMLAADELHPTDRDKLRATGFLARNYYLFNRDTWLDDTIEHTSKAFLGLTMNCCKCHDHKYDPLTQREYYAFRAIFEPHHVRLDPTPGTTDLEVDGLPRVYDARLEAATHLYVRGNAKNPDSSEALAPDVPAVIAGDGWNPRQIPLPTEAHRPSLQAFVLADHVAAVNRQIAAARQAVMDTEQRLVQAKTSVDQRRYENVSFDDAAWADDFTQPGTSLWNIGEGTWEYAGGDLKQTETGATRRYIRSRQTHPADFIARVRFTTTGGDMWRSVGLCFDVQGGLEQMVYMSAVKPGSKLQYCYTSDGNTTYPADARQMRTVETNRPYEMTIAVRGSLLNVAIDGKHALAYQLHGERRTGTIDLIAFDAQVTLHDFRLNELPADVALADAAAKYNPQSPEEAAAALAAAQATLQAAELRLIALETAFAADRARCEKAEQECSGEVEAAAQAARVYELAAAKRTLAEAELTRQKAGQDADRKKALAAVAAARQTVKKATNALVNPGDQYTSIQASLKALDGPGESDVSRRRPYPTESTGRRSALAHWLTDAENPLVARVAVNHIWLRHFGQALVEPVNDFGLRTNPPVQQRLLDHLAVELVDSGWSTKEMHRRLVTSATYRLSSSVREADKHTVASDEANAYYWRRLPRRMESQVLRDSLLALADSLDLQQGGPTIKPQAKNATLRRSLYFTRSRDDHDDFLKMFDDADILRCYRRGESIVPQQALAMANSELSLSMARALARHIATGVDPSLPDRDSAFVHESFSLILCRVPSDAEQAACEAALASLRSAATPTSPAERQQRAEQNLVHALLNHNDFVTIR